MKANSRSFGIVSVALVAAAVSALLFGAYANGELQEYDGIDGRSYHAEMHEKGRCRSCHGVKEPKGYPEDDACLLCHEIEELVTATQPQAEEDRWQNPHDNLHYGEDVPCVECHGEHSSKAPLCANCHNFDYPTHEY